MEQTPWRELCKNQLNSNDLSHLVDYSSSSEELFRLQVPAFYRELIDLKNPKDPLLLQILPNAEEQTIKEDFSDDPVGDLQSIKGLGIIHKYQGRVLLISTGTCAINCRYCFRRNFPYTKNNASSQKWTQAIHYINSHQDIHEVILSGGDPLMLSTKVLNNLSQQLEKIKHVKTLRIHTRIPLVSPSRINPTLIQWLSNIALKKVMVLHCNHPNELPQELESPLKMLSDSGVLLLNQSVLLKNINDSSDTLCKLSHRLFDLGILPYYLNLLDKAKGTHHFNVPKKQAKQIHLELLQRLPGYLVPKLVEEISGKKNKSPVF